MKCYAGAEIALKDHPWLSSFHNQKEEPAKYSSMRSSSKPTLHRIRTLRRARTRGARSQERCLPDRARRQRDRKDREAQCPSECGDHEGVDRFAFRLPAAACSGSSPPGAELPSDLSMPNCGRDSRSSASSPAASATAPPCSTRRRARTPERRAIPGRSRKCLTSAR